MEISQIIPHIEALVFASDKALNANDITELINNAFGFLEERITLEQIESALEGIQEKYSTEFYPFELKQSGGGWQFLTKPTFHTTIAQLNGDKFLKHLSNAALESLAIIAYNIFVPGQSREDAIEEQCSRIEAKWSRMAKEGKL